MDRRWIAPLTLFVAAIAIWNLCFFTVPQWQQALVVQLGKPVRTVREPGLNFKIPFIQEVQYFDRRLLLYDAAPKELLTRDKQQLVVDNFARWRIVDPLQYYRGVRNEAAAQSRLDDVIYSNLRENLGRQTLHDIVSTRRSELMEEITRRSDERAREFGIEVVDVRIKRADLPEKNEQNVFSRMRAERERLAKKFRAEGEEEAQKIRSIADKDVRILLADAKKKAAILRGEGEAAAVKIFADAHNQGPRFFAFQRSLEAYRNAIQKGSTLVLSPQSDFFRFFSSIDGGEASEAAPTR